MKPRPVIAIDGPAGAGKSTVARMVCQRTGLAMLDTGAMYRGIAWAAHRDKLDVADAGLMTRLANEVDLQLQGLPARLVVDGVDVGDEIRTLEIGQDASRLSEHSGVRQALVAQQQRIIEAGGFVLEGRDVTTVVAPKAELKIFLTASVEERGRRRWEESKARGVTDTLPMVIKDVISRDYRDYTRADSPLMLAEDAVIIESFGLTPEAVVDQIVELLLKRTSV